MNNDEKRAWIARYLSFASGNVCDALENLGLPQGFIRGVHPLENAQPKAAGFAVTIQQMPRSTPYDGKSRAKQAAVIDSELHEGDLLVIACGGERYACTGGGMQALRMKQLGASGELTDGCLRDVDEIAELGLPVYMAGTSPVKSARYMETTGVNVPVSLGGVQIFPGDLILMDRTAAVRVPAESLGEVAAETERIVAKELAVEEGIRAGKSIAEARRG